jgi:hypothetical protein
MKSSIKIYLFTTSLLLTTLACGVNLSLPDNAIDVGPVISENIQIANPNNGNIQDMQINFGVGDLDIRGGASPDYIIDGTTAYNVENLKPQITTSNNKTTISQETVDYEISGLPNFGDVENVWTLNFSDTPLALEIRGGALKGNFDFGSMSLQELKIFSGGATLDIDFSSPNLTPMSFFDFTTGASTANIVNLANANFSLMNFDAGVGNYLLDFSGNLHRDATVDISALGANLRIIVPSNVPAQINVTGNLNDVSYTGDWSESENSYSQPGEGASLIINIQVNGGIVSLKNN